VSPLAQHAEGVRGSGLGVGEKPFKKQGIVRFAKRPYESHGLLPTGMTT